MDHVTGSDGREGPLMTKLLHGNSLVVYIIQCIVRDYTSDSQNVYLVTPDRKHSFHLWPLVMFQVPVS